MKTKQTSDIEQINDQVLGKFKGRKQYIDRDQLYHLPQVSKLMQSTKSKGRLIALWRVESDRNYRRLPKGSFFTIYQGTIYLDHEYGFAQYLEEIGILYRLPIEIQGQIMDRSSIAMAKKRAMLKQYDIRINT